MKLPSYLKYILFIVIVLYLFRVIRKDSKNYENFKSQPTSSQPSSSQPTSSQPSSSQPTGGSGGSGGGGTSTNCKSLSGEPLLPVMDPRFNMREICKEIILLSSHLGSKDRSCIDCLQKHLLTIEALAEEGISLDKTQTYVNLLEPIPSKCRTIMKKLLSKQIDPLVTSQEFRSIRKKFMPICSTVC